MDNYDAYSAFKEQQGNKILPSEPNTPPPQHQRPIYQNPNHSPGNPPQITVNQSGKQISR